MKRLVLIADDSYLDRAVLYKILSSAYEVIQASDGREALSLFKNNSDKLSAIIVDLHMPDMDGFSLIKSITSDSKWRQLPILVASGEKDISQQEEVLRLGAMGFLEKPYNQTILLHTLHNSIELHEMAALANSVRIDELTGLYNRRGFLEKAAIMIVNAPKEHYMVTVLNFEHFKLINDQYGTTAGDRLLKFAAKVIKESLSLNKEEGIAGRLYSDKFIILSLAKMTESKEHEEFHNILSSPPFLPQKVRFRLGRCLVDDPNRPLASYVDRASMAEQSINGDYGSYIAVYNNSMMDELLKRQAIASHMVIALQNREFQPYFQPQFNHVSGEVIGAEALVRWNHDGKLISPNDFIPLFEQNGFIYEMDRYIWEKVCINLRKWIDQGINPPPISVNVSRVDLLHKHCQEFLLSLLKKYSLPIYLLRIEITESAFSNLSPVFNAIENLINAGFTVEIDDFGSGYSSLNSLKDMKASILKLDMRFFAQCADEARSGTIVQFSVRLAKWLKMEVIAEGVETSSQADFLKSIGCFFIQNYLYSKPLPLSDFENLLVKGPLKRPAPSPSTIRFRLADINNPTSLDSWIYKTKAGPACLLEIRDNVTEVLRVNDNYILALKKIGLTVNDVLKINWMDYFNEETKKLFPNIQKRIQNDEKDVEGDLVFINMPNCPPTLTIRTKQTLLAKGPDSIIVYCAVEFI